MFDLVDKNGSLYWVLYGNDCVNLDALTLTEDMYFVKGKLKSKPKYIEFISVFADYDVSETDFYKFLIGTKVLDEYTCYDTTPEYMIYTFACFEPYQHSLTFKHTPKQL